ncbi:M3 family metallopeptidase [bacterium]|nr:M3 family metallopeptidase [bacterium]
MSENPFFKPFATPHESFPFNEIKLEHYEPAFEQGIKEAKLAIEKIKGKKEDANFSNTIEALEDSSDLLDKVSTVFFNLMSAEAGDEHHALAQKLSPKLTEYENDVLLDPDLFSRVKAVWENRESFTLSLEQARILEKTYKGFVRNGALLNDEKKTALRKIDEEISTLWPKFSENVLKATNAYELLVENAVDLEGMPDAALEEAQSLAEEKSKKGWIFTLQAPSYIPFLTYCPNEKLRENLWRAFATRAVGGEFDNKAIVKKIVGLKHKRAQLLGFDHHANYVLTERMAQHEKKVFSFLEEILEKAFPAAEKEVEQVRALKEELSGVSKLNSWDFAYYSEKLKKKLLDFDEEELRPFFKLDSVVEGVFEHAKKLFQIEFKKVSNVQKYHPDVEVYEVYDTNDSSFVGLFYTDFYPRKTKKGGAWMTTYRSQHFSAGEDKRPHVSIVCNFSKPTKTKPSLISLNEVTTLFHEFGHSLHSLLSRCQYRSVSGTSVYWDFVELPSQIMENWVYEKEALDMFAKHYEKGDLIPEALVKKIKKTMHFMAGYSFTRQLQFGLLDMAWHTADPSEIVDVEDFEAQATEATRLFERIPGTCSSCAFSHIFAGGYAAGYYSYKWAEVLDADAFEYFLEKGLFSQEVSQSFKENILSKGGSEHPMELYKRFRGREPDANALLRRAGLSS